MFSHDMKEILGDMESASPKELAKGSLVNVDKKEKKELPKKAIIKKPKGMSRELYNLLIHQGREDKMVTVMPTNMPQGYSSVKAQIGLRKVRRWEWKPFVNEGRKDQLKLCHWEREDRKGTPYPFAKFSKSIEVPKFSADEYNRFLRHPNWTEEETTHLLDLCQRFDLRWPIIADRYDKTRFGSNKVMEDLKERYYSLERELQQARGQQSTEYTYDAEHEKRRKEQLCKLWDRTEQEVKEEEELIAALKKIQVKRKEREKKAHDLQKLINATERTSLSPESSAGFSPAGSGMRGRGRGASLKGRSSQVVAAHLMNHPEGPAIRFTDYRSAGPHLRSQEMKLPANVGQKKLKNIDNVIAKMNIPVFPQAHEEIVQHFNEFRSNIVLLQDLKGALQTAESELEALRERMRAEKRQLIDVPARVRVPEGDDAELPTEIAANEEEAAPTGLPTTRRRICSFIDANPAGVQGRKRRIHTHPSPSPDVKRAARS